MRLPTLLILQIIGFCLFAQSSKLKNQEFSFSVGARELYIEKFSPTENIDFINYVDTYPEFIDYIMVKLGYKFDFLSKMTAEIKLILMDDLIPDNYDISAHYFFKPAVGIGIGSMLNKSYITNFEKHKIQALPDYLLMDENMQQFTTYDLGFYLSPALKPIDNKLIKLQIKCDFGLSAFLNEETNFYHKKKLSNEKLQFHYKTKTTVQPYIQPKLELKLKAFTIKQTSLGILLNSSYYHSSKSIDYERTTYYWTIENSTKEKIQTPKHSFSRLDFDLGFFVNW